MSFASRRLNQPTFRCPTVTGSRSSLIATAFASRTKTESGVKRPMSRKVMLSKSGPCRRKNGARSSQRTSNRVHRSITPASKCLALKATWKSFAKSCGIFPRRSARLKSRGVTIGHAIKIRVHFVVTLTFARSRSIQSQFPLGSSNSTTYTPN